MLLTKRKTDTKRQIDNISQNNKTMTIPFKLYSNDNNLVKMIKLILDEEFPMLKNNLMLHDLVLYTLTQKLSTIQNVENALSYIKDNNIKDILSVYFVNREVRIKCSI